MKSLRWVSGGALLAGGVWVLISRPPVFLFYHDLPNVAFFGKALYVLLAACFFGLFRIVVGPTAPDRMAALNAVSVLIVGLCALLTISTQRSWYINIAIAWALQSFVCMLAFSKFLEGKGLDE
jgi:multicomponent Na+:H+ antiporter subunit F